MIENQQWYGQSRKQDWNDVKEIEDSEIIRWAGLENRELIQDTFRQRGQRLREVLRDECRLLMTRDGETRRVKVELRDWMPERIVEIVRSAIHDKSAWVERNSECISEAAKTVGDVSSIMDSIVPGARYEVRPGTVYLEDVAIADDIIAKIEIKENLRLTEQLLRWLVFSWLPANRPEIDPVRRLFLTGRNVLGRYYPFQGVIHIYWPVIVYVARHLNLPVGELASKVLVHEYAHAFTHIGLDIDGRDWATDAFVRTTADVLEGLAQYYTQCVAKRVKDKFPGIDRAYVALLDRQSGPYRAHVDVWAKDVAPKKESVRRAMMVIRSKREPASHQDLLDNLKEAEAALITRAREETD